MPTLADFKTDAKSWWCPGCGDFAVLAALQRALVNEGLEPHNVALVAGIGCSGKIGNYINCYNFHVTHGRTLPTAMGLKLANRDLTVLAAGGDGDGFAIGMGHFMHAVRRNPDITYIVMDNHIYGLTKGICHFAVGFAKSAAPENIERPVTPLTYRWRREPRSAGFSATSSSGQPHPARDPAWLRLHQRPQPVRDL